MRSKGKAQGAPGDEGVPGDLGGVDDASLHEVLDGVRHCVGRPPRHIEGEQTGRTISSQTPPIHHKHEPLPRPRRGQGDGHVDQEAHRRSQNGNAHPHLENKTYTLVARNMCWDTDSASF